VTPRLLLIPTENHTMVPRPEPADLVRFAVEAAGIDGVMVGDDGGVADLGAAVRSVTPAVDRGFSTFCVKPSQFTDDAGRIGEFCRDLVKTMALLGRSGAEI
jgi:hypothetical protein